MSKIDFFVSIDDTPLKLITVDQVFELAGMLLPMQSAPLPKSPSIRIKPIRHAINAAASFETETFTIYGLITRMESAGWQTRSEGNAKLTTVRQLISRDSNFKKLSANEWSYKPSAPSD